MSSVRIALLQDLDPVNKSELRTFDAWHELMTASMRQLDNALGWLDAAADPIAGSDIRFTDMRALYANSPYGTAIQTRLELMVA